MEVSHFLLGFHYIVSLWSLASFSPRLKASWSLTESQACAQVLHETRGGAQALCSRAFISLSAWAGCPQRPASSVGCEDRPGVRSRRGFHAGKTEEQVLAGNRNTARRAEDYPEARDTLPRGSKESHAPAPSTSGGHWPFTLNKVTAVTDAGAS